ncbi:MAG: iron complex outerrane recepter protein [Thermoanaerobaculia bacterium]|jgi:outer membrane receptor protein involved in Fe transport|nr:iron complex outerrane recepter protein [Thermoanaerobaculia bacterium]
MVPLLALSLLLLDDPPPPLKPTAADTIVVTATNTPARLGDSPASVVVISREAMAATAAATTDEALRQVPGFTLFRRSSSRSANPTSQGVSLRGIGASGASRALVLDDGIPLNDPFGGWVYWGRIPRQAISRIEVVRGGASDLYGSGAMGGVVQFIRRGSAANDLSFDASGGSEQTGASSLFASMKRGDWSGSIAAGWLSTNGYVLVQPSQRGAVDVEADTRNTTIDLTLRRNESFLRLSHYAESRNNGTPMQINDTAIRQIAAGTDARIGSGSIVVRAYGSDQDYHQTFSAIAANRNSERLTVDQRVPSSGRGGSLQWFSTFGRNVIVAGADLRQVRGASDEIQYAVTGKITSSRVAGRQNDDAVYIEDVATLSRRVTLAAGVRFDSWRNFDAERNGAALTDRSDDAWSPRLTLLVHVSNRLTLTAAAYRSFRAPSLNELYRAFRVGNVQTLANEDLGAEHLSAFELGARSGPLRLTMFSMTTDDTIANVTLSSTPSLITRQRRNLGSSRSRGAELEAEEWLSRRWRVSAGYLFCDAVVASSDLAGKRLPQVPRNTATVQLAFNGARGSAGLQARWSSMQFDDDLNQFPLRSYAVADLFAAYPIASHFEATFAVENATNRRVEVSATPVITLGAPRTVRVGVRYSMR